jgi:hypothetical protein
MSIFFFSREKYQNLIDELKFKVEALEDTIVSLKAEVVKHAPVPPAPPPPKEWKRGDRVKGSATCGFNASMVGTVQYVEPSGKVWVRRDGSSSDVYYFPNELVEA